MVLLAFAVAAALILSFACSIAEATLLSLSPGQVARLVSENPPVGRIWQKFKRSIDHPISVILLINTAAHTIGAATAGAQFVVVFGSEHVVLFSIVFTLVMFQLTEIAPKTLGVRHCAFFARILAKPLALSVWLATPLLALIRTLNRPFAGRRNHAAAPIPVEEITALAALACLSNVISSEQEEMIRGAVRLSSMTAGDAMIPLDEVAFLSLGHTSSEAISNLRTKRQARCPVIEGDDRDNVLGYVNFTDLVYATSADSEAGGLTAFLQPVRTVATEAAIPEVLNLLVSARVPMVIVRDRGGHTVGLLTIENIVAELVGKEHELDRA